METGFITWLELSMVALINRDRIDIALAVDILSNLAQTRTAKRE